MDRVFNGGKDNNFSDDILVDIPQLRKLLRFLRRLMLAINLKIQRSDWIGDGYLHSVNLELKPLISNISHGKGYDVLTNRIMTLIIMYINGRTQNKGV